MSVLDMDVSARRSPQSIRKRRFAVVRRGFDPDQVQSYLEQIAGWIEQLESELHTAREDLEAAGRRAEQPVDPYGRLGTRVAELMRTAEEQAERIRRDAEEEASRKLDDLQGEIERIREESRTRVERLQREADDEATRMRTEAAQTLERARAEANAVLAALTGQRDMLVGELRNTRTRLSNLVDEIDATVGATPLFPREPASAPLQPSPPASPFAAEPESTLNTRDLEVQDPFGTTGPESPLFDDFAGGPSYEGTGTGRPLFEDTEFRPRGLDGLGGSNSGRPASFDLPPGEPLDLGAYVEDENETTPTIDLSLPDIPSFEDEDETEGEGEGTAGR
jgi:cell division initiation protein